MPPPSPKPAARELVHFLYSSPEPWSWIPGTWIQPGVVFVTGDGSFYRFVERTDDGWKAEEVDPAQVGDQSRVAEIRTLRAQYEEVLTAHDELDREMREGKDTPENRKLLHERDETLHQLRDRIILLCNGRSPEARAAAKPDQDYWKLTMLGVLALVFLLSLVYCVKSLLAFDRSLAGTILAGSVFFLSGLALAVIGIRELNRRRNKLVTGNLVGCFTLVTLVLVAVSFGIVLVSVALLYMGAYSHY